MFIHATKPFEIKKGQCNDQRSDLDLFEVSLFPNPTNGKIWISGLDTESGIVDIKIYDLQGRLCILKHFNRETNSLSFDISLLKDGLYIVSIQMDMQEIQKKLIVSN